MPVTVVLRSTGTEGVHCLTSFRYIAYSLRVFALAE